MSPTLMFILFALFALVLWCIAQIRSLRSDFDRRGQPAIVDEIGNRLVDPRDIANDAVQLHEQRYHKR